MTVTAEDRAFAVAHLARAEAEHHPNGDHDDGPPVLPAGFWSARPILERVRDVARARGAAPDAVLVATLAHLSVRTPPTVTLPPIVGGPGSFNFCAAIIGVSGSGKGVAMRTSDDALPPFTDREGSGPLGTGPGMLDVYFRRSKDETPDRHRDAFLFVADEGQVLEKLAAGQGSTTLETLRAGWSGERVGAATVGAPWRVLAPGGYRMAFLLGLQPVIARPLLADTAGGTPQRFVFAGTVDPAAPLARPADIRPSLGWKLPTLDMPFRVAASVKDEIIRRRHEVLTGRRIPGVYDSHRDQLRLKVAALLGILAGRLSATVEDWALAGMVLDVSDAVREATLAAHRATEAALEAGANARAATRARAEESARRRVVDDVVRVARIIERSLAKNGPTARGKLRTAVKSDDRADWFDDALAHAEAQGWVESDDRGHYSARSNVQPRSNPPEQEFQGLDPVQRPTFPLAKGHDQ